jgi:hypothetical protein
MRIAIVRPGAVSARLRSTLVAAMIPGMTLIGTSGCRLLPWLPAAPCLFEAAT